VCQVGDLFGLNTGRGSAAAREGVGSGCGSASRIILGDTCRHCESPTRIREVNLPGPRQGRDPGSDRTALRAGTLGAPGAAARPPTIIRIVLLAFEHGGAIRLLSEASHPLDLQQNEYAVF
jgi:hypothetical protein